MAAHNQRQPQRRRSAIAAAALTLALALSAPHLALAGTGATTSKTTAPAATATSAKTSRATVAAITSSAAAAVTTTKALAQTTRATTPTTKTNAANAITTTKALAQTTRATTPTTKTNAATTTTTKEGTHPPSTRRPLDVVTLHTTPKPKPAELPPSIVDGLTGGCVNATGSRSRMSKKHVDVLVAALTMYMKMTIRFDALNQPFHPLVAGSVRLGFHACANASCGGCINVHNDANNGLNITIDALSDFLNQLKAFEPFADCDITYADLWQAAASTALRFGLFDKSLAKFYVPIVFGRKDCPTAPYTDDIIPYPDRRDTIDKVLSFFKVRFGLEPREVVAVMGAHSFGVIRDLSTLLMKGQWDKSPDAAKTDFYSILANQAKVWLPTPVKYTGVSYPIYSFSKGKNFLFLTPDFSLARNITLKNETTGEPACRLDACPFSSTYKDVVFFSKNATNWAQTFSTAYTRITTAGYAPGVLQGPV